MSAPAASWCDPTGGSPAQVRGSARLVASIAWPLATGVAKRTQRLHGCGIEPRKIRYCGGREFYYSLEGNMCGTAMRGADALPGSKATSRAKGSHRKLGDLGSDRNGGAVAGPHREGEEP